jgi:hypothetical protein
MPKTIIILPYNQLLPILSIITLPNTQKTIVEQIWACEKTEKSA